MFNKHNIYIILTIVLIAFLIISTALFLNTKPHEISHPTYADSATADSASATTATTATTASASATTATTATNEQNEVTIENHLEHIENIIRSAWGDDLPKVGAVYYDTASGRSVQINENNNFQAASTIKVSICLEICNRIANGDIGLYDNVYFNPATDYDATMYSDYRLQQPFVIRDLMRDVMIYSDNVAANMLLGVLNHTGHHEFIETLGSWTIMRYNNLITPAAGIAVLKHLYNNPNNNELYSMVIGDMKDSALHDRITRDIPIEICAHKSGDYIGFANDTAIVYTDNPFILVFYTDNVYNAHNRIAIVSKLIYDAHNSFYNYNNGG